MQLTKFRHRYFLIFLLLCTFIPVSLTSQVQYRDLLRRNDTYLKRNTGQPYSGLLEDYFPSGSIKVKGQFKDGLMEGEWEYYHESGGVWGRGNYIRGNGKDPSPVSGIPKDGRNGIWRFYDENGNISSQYHYERGKQTGVQKEWYSNGVLKSLNDFDTERQQQWYDNGQIAFDDDPRNDIYRAWYVDGQERILRHNEEGIVREWYSDGQLRQKGQVQDALKEGEWIYYSENEKIIKKIFYEQGNKTAELYVDDADPELNHWREYYPNGRMKVKGMIIDSGRDSLWTVYYLNGRIKEKGSYKNNRRHGIWYSYNISNILVREEEFLNGQRHGKYIIHFDDGSEKIIGEYKNGSKNGFWTYRYENGDWKTGHFSNGMKIGPWEFHSADGSCMTIVFMDDKPIKPNPY